MHNTAKNYTIEMEIFNDEDTNPDDKENNIKEKDKNNIDLPTADRYSHVVAIIHMCWKE